MDIDIFIVTTAVGAAWNFFGVARVMIAPWILLSLKWCGKFRRMFLDGQRVGFPAFCFFSAVLSEANISIFELHGRICVCLCASVCSTNDTSRGCDLAPFGEIRRGHSTDLSARGL